MTWVENQSSLVPAELIEVDQELIRDLRSKGLGHQASLVLKQRKKWLEEQRRIDKKISEKQLGKVNRHFWKMCFGRSINWHYKNAHKPRAYRFAAVFYRRQETRRFKEYRRETKIAVVSRLEKNGFETYD